MASSTIPFALIVDDQALIRLDVCDILSEAGFRPLEAENGDEAKRILDHHGVSITLLFTDVQMPGSLNGFALARYAAENWQEIEIVVASGNFGPGPGEMPDRATFISKPFDAAMVHEHLKKTLPDGKKPDPLKTAF